MVSASRFECASSSLTLRGLLRKTKRVFWICFGLGIAAHISLSQMGGFEAEQKVVKPLTTQFIKRQPRLTKPLELKKRPRPKRRMMQRKMVSIQARVNRKEVSSVGVSTHVLGKLARPDASIYRETAFAQMGLETEAVASYIEGTMQPKDNLNMALEMMDIDALDTARYQAMVIQDPNDKRNIKGYLRLAVAYPYSVRDYEQYDNLAQIMTALNELVLKLNEWTDIKASISKQITFDSSELFETPWIYLWLTYTMQPTRGEVENLGKYLLNGGFFFFEGHQWRTLQGERYLMQFVQSALASQGYQQGVEWEYQLLPNTHPIYHCYYDFADGPPMSHVGWSKSLYGTGRDDDDIRPRTKGIEIGGRLVAINTNQGYLVSWYARGKVPNEPEFRFGINTIVFALTQEGSITHRLMDSVE